MKRSSPIVVDNGQIKRLRGGRHTLNKTNLNDIQMPEYTKEKVIERLEQTKPAAAAAAAPEQSHTINNKKAKRSEQIKSIICELTHF